VLSELKKNVSYRREHTGSIYTSGSSLPRVCPWGTHFCERSERLRKYISRDNDDAVLIRGELT